MPYSSAAFPAFNCLNGQDYYDPCEQRKCFLQYFEDLSIPKDKGYDNGYLELCNIRQKLITQIYSEDSSPIEPFKEEDVSKAVKQLNAGKVILSIQTYTSSFFVHMDHSNLVHSDIYKQFLCSHGS
jgi:hypothetical protein